MLLRASLRDRLVEICQIARARSRPWQIERRSLAAITSRARLLAVSTVSQKVLMAAKVAVGGRAVDCTVRDISETGARLPRSARPAR
jgi:hypothetical protein